MIKLLFSLSVIVTLVLSSQPSEGPEKCDDKHDGSIFTQGTADERIQSLKSEIEDHIMTFMSCSEFLDAQQRSSLCADIQNRRNEIKAIMPACSEHIRGAIMKFEVSLDQQLQGLCQSPNVSVDQQAQSLRSDLTEEISRMLPLVCAGNISAIHGAYTRASQMSSTLEGLIGQCSEPVANDMRAYLNHHVKPVLLTASQALNPTNPLQGGLIKPVSSIRSIYLRDPPSGQGQVVFNEDIFKIRMADLTNRIADLPELFFDSQSAFQVTLNDVFEKFLSLFSGVEKSSDRAKVAEWRKLMKAQFDTLSNALVVLQVYESFHDNMSMLAEYFRRE